MSRLPATPSTTREGILRRCRSGLACLLWLAAATTCWGAAAEPEPVRPNVLLIVMDTVRADHLSCYGHRKDTTPNLDRLATEGVLFEKAISAGSWTVPSHATLFTGLYLRDHKTTAAHWKLGAEFTTLAEELTATGYTTAGFSNNPWLTEGTGLTQGFGSFRDVWRSPLQSRAGDEGAALTVELVLEWVDSRSGGERPFFAFVNLMEPHLPYDPPGVFESRVLSEGIGPDLLAELRGWKHPREVGYILGVSGYEVTREQFRGLEALYDAEISYVDSKIGELIYGLESRGLLEDTLVIVTSDHGEHLGDHDLMDHKFSLYDALIHVPLIIRYPRAVPQGVRIRGQVQTNDLFATVLGMTGVQRSPPPGAFSLPFDNGPAKREHTIAEFGPPTEFLRIISSRFPGASDARFDRSLVAIRGVRYKYIWASDGDSELFDVVQDPHEERDLSAERVEVVGDLHAKLLAFYEGRPLPTR